MNKRKGNKFSWITIILLTKQVKKVGSVRNTLEMRMDVSESWAI